MKNLMLNYINRGETKNSRFLRLTTVSLSTIFASSIVLYWMYYFLIVKMDSFTLHPKTMYEFMSKLVVTVTIFLYENVMQNYLFIALFFLIFILYRVFNLYEKEDIRKISDEENRLGVTLFLFAVASIYFIIKVIFTNEYVNSFYGFLTFIISSFVIYFFSISLFLNDMNEVGDSAKYLKNVYMRSNLSKTLIVIYIISLLFSLYEVNFLMVNILAALSSLVNMSFILSKNSIGGFEEGRLSKLKLRGFDIPKANNDGNPFAYVYAFSLSECIKRGKFMMLTVSDEKVQIDINSFSEELEKIYIENNIDREHLVFLCIKEYSLEKNEDEDSNFYINLLIDVYDLDNNFLSGIDIRSDFEYIIESKW